MAETKAWAVARPSGSIELRSISETRKLAISAMRFCIPWRLAYGRGFRCIRVTITEDTK